MSVRVEVDITAKTPDYGMFTDLGNAAVHAIVVSARANGMTWAQVYRALVALAEYKEFGEATDTAVRECVYDAIAAAERDEDFWV